MDLVGRTVRVFSVAYQPLIRRICGARGHRIFAFEPRGPRSCIGPPRAEAGQSYWDQGEGQQQTEQSTAGRQTEEGVGVTDRRWVASSVDVDQRLEAEEDKDDRPREANQEDREQDLQPA